MSMVNVAVADGGGGGSKRKGLKPEETRIALQKLQKEYDILLARIKDEMKADEQSGTDNEAPKGNSILDLLLFGWAAEHSVDFVKNTLAPTLKGFADQVTAAMQNVNDVLNQGARNWDNNFGKGDWRNIAFVPVMLSIPAIAPFAGFFMGIRAEFVKLAMQKMEDLKKDVESFINKCKSICAKSGFEGGNQQSQLDTSISTIGKGVAAAMNAIEQGTGVKADSAVNTGDTVANSVAGTFGQ